MTTPNHATLLINTQTAAMLTGKTSRTITNWLETGVIQGESVRAGHLPQGQLWQVDISSMAAHIPAELTDEFLESVKKAESGDAQETTNVGVQLYKAGSQKIALDWFELAAKRGNADAMEWLWDSYYYGRGTESNYAVAVQWLGKAAEHGSMIAKATLNNLHKINKALEEQGKEAMNAIRRDIWEMIKPKE